MVYPGLLARLPAMVAWTPRSPGRLLRRLWRRARARLGTRLGTVGEVGAAQGVCRVDGGDEP
jgi:hypothetical protein